MIICNCCIYPIVAQQHCHHPHQLDHHCHRHHQQLDDMHTWILRKHLRSGFNLRPPCLHLWLLQPGGQSDVGEDDGDEDDGNKDDEHGLHHAKTASIPQPDFKRLRTTTRAKIIMTPQRKSKRQKIVKTK